MWYFVGAYCISIIAAFCIYAAVDSKNRKKNRWLYYANCLIRQEILNHQICNPYKNKVLKVPKAKRLMIIVTTGTGSRKVQSVFDPEKGVSFGRGNTNEIVIKDEKVSLNHGMFYIGKEGVYLKNNSQRSYVVIKRSAFSKKKLKPNYATRVHNGDKIVVCGNVIGIEMFVYDYNKAVI